MMPWWTSLINYWMMLNSLKDKSGTSDQVGYDLYQDSGNLAKLYIQTPIDDNVI